MSGLAGDSERVQVDGHSGGRICGDTGCGCGSSTNAGVAKSGLTARIEHEEWRSTFTLTEAGSQVHESARLHDSLVLAGGKVGAGAVVVRCLVGPGGVVGESETVFDELIGAEGGGSNDQG